MNLTQLKVKVAAGISVLLSYLLLYQIGPGDWKVVTAAVVSTMLVIAVVVRWVATWEVDDGTDGYDERWGS